MTDIKLFNFSDETLGKNGVAEISSNMMALERPLQTLFEQNLENLLGIRFLASEYAITEGRIDTLGLDENNCPVIIEYKRHSSENIINQGLFYMYWLMDHQADFKLLTIKKLGDKQAEEINWSLPRLVCIAADFTRYDEHAIKQMNHNIELIRYRIFGGNLLLLELLTAVKGTTSPAQIAPSGNKKKGDKPQSEIIAQAKDEHKERYDILCDYISMLGDDVQENMLKHYKAFKRIKNFACVELQRGGTIKVWVYLNPDEEEIIDGFTRDVREIGHWGTGNFEIIIRSDDDLERAKPLIDKAYNF